MSQQINFSFYNSFDESRTVYLVLFTLTTRLITTHHPCSTSTCMRSIFSRVMTTTSLVNCAIKSLRQVHVILKLFEICIALLTFIIILTFYCTFHEIAKSICKTGSDEGKLSQLLRTLCNAMQKSLGKKFTQCADFFS